MMVSQQVSNYNDTAIATTLEAVKETLTTEFNKFSTIIEDKIGTAVASTIGSFIPAGLLILPPFGWWVTLNVWYIEIAGTIPEFNVVDSMDETNVHTLFGHTAQEYYRTSDRPYFDIDGDGTYETRIGVNIPVEYNVNTGTFVIVPSGKTGVGDRTGEYDEHEDWGIFEI